MDYLKNNINDLDMMSLIKDHISTSTPFSFTRYGDGEIHILNRNFPNTTKNRFTGNWGFKPNEYEKALDMFYPIIRDSLIGSDVVGLMDEENNKGFIRVDYSNLKWSLPYSILIKMGLDPSTMKVADHQLPRKKIMGDINEFKKILCGNSIHILSPHTNKLKNNNISKILGVDVGYTTTPLSMTLKDRPKLISTLDNIKESVVIYGCAAGVKDVGTLLKNRGKISLDFGATLGGWAGIVERPWFTSTQKHCLITNKK